MTMLCSLLISSLFSGDFFSLVLVWSICVDFVDGFATYAASYQGTRPSLAAGFLFQNDTTRSTEHQSATLLRQ